MPLLHRLFEDASKVFEDSVAVVFNERGMTYGELDRRAEALSRAILHCAGEEEIIGIDTTRSPEMVVGLLAILKSGKAYLPLDPGFPAARLAQVVSGSGIRYCVCGPAGEGVFRKLGLEPIPRDAPGSFPDRAAVRRNPDACVLYTSGSTGRPKGVRVPHRGLVNFLLWQKEHSKAGPGLRTLQFCHLGFDVSIEEIFVPLITGGTLYLVDDSYRLDSANLLSFVEGNAINRMYLPYVELQYFAEEAVRGGIFPPSLREVLTGGELLKITPQIAAFFHALPHCPLVNKYGPTEACVWVTELELSGEALDWPEIPTIGRPIAGTRIFLLDEGLEQVPDGETGEICVHGACTANGYLNEPGLTAGSFISWTGNGHRGIRLYRTGDLGRQLPDGSIEFHGRRDGQVKIRGNRIELADIEIALARQQGVRQAVVLAREDVPGMKYLAAYLVGAEGEIPVRELRERLAGLLPDFMVPSYFIRLDGLPETPSGKVDRKRLPKPETKRPDLGVLYRKPSTETERDIAGTVAAVLGFDRVGTEDNFFGLGGNSLLAQKTVSELRHRFGHILPITKLYQFPTVRGMAGYIGDGRSPAVRPGDSGKERPGDRDGDIAVIAMSGRFPGAGTVGEFWEALRNGKETLSFFREDELDPAVPAPLRNDPLYVRARGTVKDVEQFDPEFFGINPRLAELMDPQQRLFMEISWEALENAGYLPANGHSNTGVFAGVYNNTYFLNNVQHNRELVDRVGEFQVMSANEKDFVASRTAYHLNLKGPAVSVYSACSTSLLAIAQAVESLRKGQCALALAGGASVHSPVNSGHLYQEGAMLSSDGHCRPFDADSTGTLFCDGAGVVLLKDLQRAEEDGDTVYAVIKGVGVNNDGGGKGSFTAPSAEGQAGAIGMALRDARVDPASIGYVEAHGTGTPLGDPIEMEGLALAFGPQPRRQYCAVGSVKGNMGHLTAAAGAAGFIKTVLALHHRQIPPSLGFKRPNPHIDFENSPFYVNGRLRDWEQEGPRRAGVSSFGVGGTNVHVVLEEAVRETPAAYDGGRDAQLVTWSARSPRSLEAYGRKLLDFCRSTPDAGLADVAFTLQTARPGFGHRRFLVAPSMEGLTRQLAGPGGAGETNSLGERPGETVFSFPGQGAQYPDMGRGLYEGEAVYKEAVDTCAGILEGYMGTDIRGTIFPARPDRAAGDRLRDTRHAQPALFVTGYALARLWMSWGVRPTVLCGHSIGEFVAAHLAGVFSLEDALKLIAARGALIGSLPGGGMLSVRAGADELESAMPRELSVAAINGRNLCVLSGAEGPVAAFARELDRKGVPNRPLLTSHAFHSPMMDPAVEDFKRVAATVTLRNPRVPVISAVTGTWLKDGEATDPGYWAGHIRKTVNFAGALDTVAALENPLFIETGPGNVTSALAKQQLSGRGIPIITSMERAGDSSGQEGLLRALGRVWLHGIEPDWAAFYGGRKRSRLVLPNYAFDRRRCWVSPPSPAAPAPAGRAERAVPERAGEEHAAPATRKERIQDSIREILGASGIVMAGTSTGFLEMGLDSLLLTQISLTLKKEFGLPVTFRQLNEEYGTPALLAEYLDRNLPGDFYREQDAPAGTGTVQGGPTADSLSGGPEDLRAAMELMNRQLKQLSEQMDLIRDRLANGQPQPGATGRQPAAPPDSISNGDSKYRSSQGATGETNVADLNEKKEPGNSGSSENPNSHFMVPPVPGARLGKDQNGNPAWFMANPDKPGSYFQLID